MRANQLRIRRKRPGRRVAGSAGRSTCSPRSACPSSCWPCSPTSSTSPPPRSTTRCSNVPSAPPAPWPGSRAANGPAGGGLGTGGALLAGDPHLPQTIPSVWYEEALSTPGFDVAGVSVPGLPGILIGHNARIAWSLTDTQNQATLFYDEKTAPASTSGTANDARCRWCSTRSRCAAPRPAG